MLKVPVLEFLDQNAWLSLNVSVFLLLSFRLATQNDHNPRTIEEPQIFSYRFFCFNAKSLRSFSFFIVFCINKEINK
jgi:hypothetical protein